MTPTHYEHMQLKQNPFKKLNVSTASRLIPAAVGAFFLGRSNEFDFLGDAFCVPCLRTGTLWSRSDLGLFCLGLDFFLESFSFSFSSSKKNISQKHPEC